jgi:hypothetical protein
VADWGVPEISRFFGIVIGMFYDEHGPPHFHARYGEYKISIEIETGACVGHIPTRTLILIQHWLRIHRAELIDNWNRARVGEALAPVAPLE